MWVYPLKAHIQAARLIIYTKRGNNMTSREYAKANHFEVVGKLSRVRDKGFIVKEKIFVDEAGNEFHLQRHFGKWACTYIITADGGVL